MFVLTLYLVCLPFNCVSERIQHAHLYRSLAMLSFILQKTRIQVWLYEQAHMRIEGKIIVRKGRVER